MKKTFKLSILIFALLLVFSVYGVTLAQTTKHTLEDYGLTAETVKYLSQEEIYSILNSKTPAEVLAEGKAEINKSGTLEQKEAINNPKLVNPALLDGTVDCFDYYKFGSVQTSLTASSFSFNAGDTINFSGPVTNENDYPIVSGTLYVKIFKNTNTVKNANGPDVVDQFIAVDNITIPAKGSVPISFSWKVPLSAVSGDYRIASFFTVDKKFNLLGLSFTDDVIGNTFNFNINGEKSNVQFDKTGVTINDKPFFFAAFPPRISIKEPAVVLAKIDNTTNTEETVDIVWKLYRWDGINPNNLIWTANESVIVTANSSKNTQVTILNTEDPVYYLIGELTYKDSKSIINVRFVRPEIDKIRLNFPSITNFPLKIGSTSTMFSCLHNSGTSQTVQDGKLVLKITDSNGKTINEKTYQGPITGEMMAVKKDFISGKNLDHFFLTAQLWQADKLVDQSTMEYDCNKIDLSLCNKKSGLTIWILIGIIILVIIIVGIVFIKRKNIFKHK